MMKNFLAGLMAGMVFTGGAAIAFPGLQSIRFEHKVVYSNFEATEQIVKREEASGWACMGRERGELIFIRIK